MPLSNLRKRINKLERFDIESEVKRIIEQNGDWLLSKLRQQLSRGKDADGAPALAVFGPFYADRTVLHKEFHGVGLGKRTDVVTNYMSGNFYLSLDIQVSNNNFVFTSNVPYFGDILQRSRTHRIVELNNQDLAFFSKYILYPQLRQSFNGL
jgi:hypothetical protein